MKARLVRIIKISMFAVSMAVFGIFTFIAYSSQSGPNLEIWHTYVPEELSLEALKKANFQDYVRHEEQLFADLKKNVIDQVTSQSPDSQNRFNAQSSIYPGNFDTDWNRTFVFMPESAPVGAAVFLHGLTDSPYSSRHIAKRYAELGFVAIGLRVPAHGTVPAALSSAEWENWSAATRIAVREAKRLSGADKPLHLIGFSNGGALAMKYALDALEDQSLARPDRIVLLSPMIGVTRFARFAGLTGLPAFFPAFAKAAWLGVVPEFNPFKYNSFPVNGARQSHRLTMALQQQIIRLARNNKIVDIAPVITFQSVMDFTVSTSAIITHLYAHLPKNGSELVLFDINRATTFGQLMRPASNLALNRLMPNLPLRYRLTVIANTPGMQQNTTETRIEPATSRAVSRPLAIVYPAQIFSLSHVALPFPVTDPLYGMAPLPGTERQYGVGLGTLVARGERGALVINLDSLFRIASNPFFDYMLGRIEEGLVPAVFPRDTEYSYIPAPDSDEQLLQQLLGAEPANNSTP